MRVKIWILDSPFFSLAVWAMIAFASLQRVRGEDWYHSCLREESIIEREACAAPGSGVSSDFHGCWRRTRFTNSLPETSGESQATTSSFHASHSTGLVFLLYTCNTRPWTSSPCSINRPTEFKIRYWCSECTQPPSILMGYWWRSEWILAPHHHESSTVRETSVHVCVCVCVCEIMRLG